MKNILAIDVGGTNVKILASGGDAPVKIPSGPAMTAERMVEEVKQASAEWKYSAVSIGYPGFVHRSRIIVEPYNLGAGWVGFDFEKAFAKPVKIINDAAMQALGSYQGGRMLFLGLGTGLGSALIIEGVIEPMELAHLPYRKGRTFEDYAGRRGLERLGKKKWRQHVSRIVDQFQKAFGIDDTVLGGGNAELLKDLPAGARLGENANAFQGGFRLWDPKG